MPLRPLSELAEFFVGIPTRISGPCKALASTRVLSVRSLSNGRIDRNELILAEIASESFEKARVRTGDVLVAARSTAFKAAVTPQDLDGTPINSTLIAIRCSPALNPHLLAAYLRHPDGQVAIVAHAQSGTAQMNITVNALSQLRVPVPPPETQRRLVELLAAADEAYSITVDGAERRRNLAGRIAFQELLPTAGYDHEGGMTA